MEIAPIAQARLALLVTDDAEARGRLGQAEPRAGLGEPAARVRTGDGVFWHPPPNPHPGMSEGTLCTAKSLSLYKKLENYMTHHRNMLRSNGPRPTAAPPLGGSRRCAAAAE
jgi:hypothetical protein